MHFASSAALLLRTINIPARYTTGFVLDESDFAYGFKENEKIEIEVFSPIGDVHKGDTLGKLSLYDENTEVTKTNFKACKDLSKECFEEIIS